MSNALSSAVPREPYLVFELDRAETLHMLRALSRASVYGVHVAMPEERLKAREDAKAYDALRSRLLEAAARRDLELRLEDGEPDDAGA